MKKINIRFLRKYRVEIICLILGVVLMLGCRLLPERESDKEKTKSNNENLSSGIKEEFNNEGEFYTVFYQKQIEEFVSKIEGVSSVSVIVYIDSVNDIVSAQNTNSSEEKIDEKDSSGGSRETITNSQSNEYVVITDKDGNEPVVVISNKMPEISGVAIYAKGASSNVVREKIINSVKSAFGLEDDEIFVCS